MCNIIIVDDDAKMRTQVAECIRKEVHEPFLTYEFTSAEDYLHRVDPVVPDIAILDIRLDAEDGISLAKKINREAPLCQIIYLSSFSTYCTDAYETVHVYFVRKEVFYDAMPKALRVALHQLNVSQKSKLLLQQFDEIKAIPIMEIAYMERHARTTQIVCFDGTTHVDEQKISDLLKQVDPGMIVICHRSYAVNVQHIQRVTPTTLYLANGDSIPVSRRRLSHVREALGKHIMSFGDNAGEHGNE